LVSSSSFLALFDEVNVVIVIVKKVEFHVFCEVSKLFRCRVMSSLKIILNPNPGVDITTTLSWRPTILFEPLDTQAPKACIGIRFRDITGLT
jgi:hypothetical protein